MKGMLFMFGAVVYLLLAFFLMWWGGDFLRDALRPDASMCPEACLWAAILLFAFSVAFLWGAVRLLWASDEGKP